VSAALRELPLAVVVVAAADGDAARCAANLLPPPAGAERDGSQDRGYSI